MSPQELKGRLDASVRKRSDLLVKTQRVLGRLEESERSLEALRVECRAKNIDPDKIDDLISKLEIALDQSLTQFETQLTAAEKTLEPFTK